MRIVDASLGRITLDVAVSDDGFRSSTWSPSGDCVAVVSGAGHLRILDASSGGITLDVELYDVLSDGLVCGSYSVAWSPTGERVAAVWEFGCSCFVDASSGGICLCSYVVVWSLAWSPSGDRVAMVSSVIAHLHVVDVISCRIAVDVAVSEFSHRRDVLNDPVAWSPSGERVMVCVDVPLLPLA